MKEQSSSGSLSSKKLDGLDSKSNPTEKMAVQEDSVVNSPNKNRPRPQSKR